MPCWDYQIADEPWKCSAAGSVTVAGAGPVVSAQLHCCCRAAALPLVALKFKTLFNWHGGLKTIQHFSPPLEVLALQVGP